VEEEVALMLTFGVDLDPILGDLDDTCVGPQDFKPCFILCSKLDARLADVAADSHARQRQWFGDRCRNRGSLPTWATLGLAHTPSMIALGCLDEGDERGGGQGLLLKSMWLRARYGYHDKVERRDETSVSTVVQGET